jgi:hypothetical protein
MSYFKKYEKALTEAGYRLNGRGVYDYRGNCAAMEDRFGTAYINDVRIKDIIAKEDAKPLAKVKEAVKKVTPKLKKVRARNADGTLRGDDPNTPDVNEAWTYVEDK